MDKQLPDWMIILIKEGLPGIIKWLVERLDKLEAVTAKPSSSAPRQTKSEEDKGVTRG